MPIYNYKCKDCGNIFEKLFFSFNDVDEDVKCSKCSSNDIIRYFNKTSVTIPVLDKNGILVEDSDKYKEMHYYEMKKDWKRAAKAAEGVSDFAYNKFIKKYEQK